MHFHLRILLTTLSKLTSSLLPEMAYPQLLTFHEVLLLMPRKCPGSATTTCWNLRRLSRAACNLMYCIVLSLTTRVDFTCKLNLTRKGFLFQFPFRKFYAPLNNILTTKSRKWQEKVTLEQESNRRNPSKCSACYKLCCKSLLIGICKMFFLIV